MNLLSIGLGVVGIAITLYLNNLGVERVPTLLVDPVRTTIIASKLFPNSSLKVTRGNDTVVSGDVTALRVYFWNAGKQSIKRENVLRPLAIYLNDTSGEILDYKILKVSRPEVIKLSLSPSTENPARELLLDFDILEENDGVACQIIYAGNPSAELTTSGVVEGVKWISSNETVSGAQFWNELRSLLPIYLAGLIGIFILYRFVGRLVVKIVGIVIGIAIRVAAWRHSIKNNADQAILNSTGLVTHYVALSLPYLFAGGLIVVIVIGLFVLLPKETARINILEAVPSSIRP